MTITIPSQFISQYHEACDLFLTSDVFSKVCTIYYPSIRVECPNCLPGIFGAGSSIYKPGGPYEFIGICPLCQSAGYVDQENTENIRLRFYPSNNSYDMTPENIEKGSAYIIGYQTDLPKVKRSDYLIFPETNNTHLLKFRLRGEPINWGFQNRYFKCQLKT